MTKGALVLYPHAEAIDSASINFANVNALGPYVDVFTASKPNENDRIMGPAIASLALGSLAGAQSASEFQDAVRHAFSPALTERLHQTHQFLHVPSIINSRHGEGMATGLLEFSARRPHAGMVATASWLAGLDKLRRESRVAPAHLRIMEGGMRKVFQAEMNSDAWRTESVDNWNARLWLVNYAHQKMDLMRRTMIRSTPLVVVK